MRIITNTQLIENRVKWARRMVTVSMGSLVICLITNVQGFYDPNLTSLSMFFLFIAMASMIVTSALVNDWLREPRADQFLADTLKRFGNDHILYSYTLSTLNILQTPACLYVITVKNQSGEITVNGSVYKQNRTLWQRIFSLFTINLLASPATDTLKAVEKVREQLQPHLTELPDIYPLVVFSDKNVKLTINQPTVPVVHDRELRAYLKENTPKQALSPQQQAILTKILSNSYQEISKGA